MEREIEFEVVRVKKTETEDKLEKAINDFKGICYVYRKIMGKKFDKQANGVIDEVTTDLIGDIKKHIRHMEDFTKRDIDALKKQ